MICGIMIGCRTPQHAPLYSTTFAELFPVV